MSDLTDPPAAPVPSKRFGFDALVTGLSLATATLFGILWWYARHELSSLQQQVTPLREEAQRYRAGLQQEVLRTRQLSEDLQAAQAGTASTK